MSRWRSQHLATPEQQDSIGPDSELGSADAETIAFLEEHGALREESLYEKLDGDRVRCNVCQRRCGIPPGRAGYCSTKLNIAGGLYTTIYGVISSAAADPIEKKPVFHYKPGSIAYSIGSLGCNFRCLFCQNWQISFADGVQQGEFCQYGVAPERLVEQAVKTRSAGIAWTYNEPSIWLSYALDGAKLAKQQGLYTVYVTNGYATPEGLDAIGPYLDVYRVDIKSMSDDFYRRLIKVPSASGILQVAKRAKDNWNMHVECVTNIIPGWNDGTDDLRRLADWIAGNLGPSTPWHVTRFFPHAEMADVPPTPPETLQTARQIGRDAGLHFVYLGNMASETGENTYCPTCGKLMIERVYYTTRIVDATAEGKCSHDGTDLNVKM